MLTTGIEITGYVSARSCGRIKKIPDGCDNRENPVVDIHHMFGSASRIGRLQILHYGSYGIANVIRQFSR